VPSALPFTTKIVIDITATVTVAKINPTNFNPLRSTIVVLRLAESSNVGAKKTFLKKLLV
jgi:hypothetical protein